MRKIVYLLPLLLLCNFVYAQTWQPHPHRTSAQQMAGISPGGEAQQWIKYFAIDPSNGNNIWAGVDTSGIWKSTDAGATWVAAGAGLRGLHCRNIAVNPGDSNNVCCYLRDTFGNDFSESYGLFTTTNGGSSWSRTNHVLAGRKYNGPAYFNDLFAWPSASNCFFATYGSGIHKSADGGMTWTPLKEGVNTLFNGITIEHIAADPLVSTNLWVCVDSGTTSTGLHRITHNGSTTVTSRQYFPSANTGDSIARKIYKTSNGNLYVVHADGSNRGIYRSTNAGVSFSSVTTTIGDINSYSIAGFRIAPDGKHAAFSQGIQWGNGSFYYTNDITATTPVWSNPSITDHQNANGWILSLNL